MAGKIDYDRGVMIKADATSGVKVFMYLDAPGVYLNIYGTPVSESLAKAAGYDTERFSKMKLKKEMVQNAIQAIEADVAVSDDFTPKTIATAAGFKLQVANPFGGHIVLSPDDDRLTPYVMPKEAAMSLLRQLAPGIPVDEVKEGGDDNPEVRADDDKETPKAPSRPRARSFADA